MGEAAWRCNRISDCFFMIPFHDDNCVCQRCDHIRRLEWSVRQLQKKTIFARSRETVSTQGTNYDESEEMGKK